MISRKISTTGDEESQQGTEVSAVPLWKRFFAGWYIPSLALVVLLAICLNFWELGQHGYSNLYYAAGVRSMLINPHNFFFASYDPNGFVALDKPPVGFWLQVLSAKMLGFSPFSVLFPQALAGVLSVVLLAHLISRSFGKPAGLLAALALTLTPISTITSRNNDVDSMLVLVILLAAWAIIIAVERGSLRWLLLSMGLVGLGFNIKMTEAYLILPAFVLLYFLTSPRGWRTRIWHLAFAGIVLFAVSLSWPIAVDLTPPAQRPFVGSSRNNTELHLIFGYNGIDRLISHSLTTQPAPPRKIPFKPSFPEKKAVATPYNPFKGGADGFRGITRLFNNQVAGQISWLLPLALIGSIVLLWGMSSHARRDKHFSRRDEHFQGLVLWGTWFLTGWVYFSFIASFQIYYMVMLAPAICALVGIGCATLWHQYTNMTMRGLLFPTALLITAAAQLYFLSPFPAWRNSELPSTIFVVVSIVALVLFILYPLKRVNFSPLSPLLTTAGMVALLLAPTIWTALPVLDKRNSAFPVAGPYRTTTPSLASTKMLTTGISQTQTSASNTLSITDFSLLHFLAEHEGNARYLYATTTANYSEAVIVETGKGVMTMGGYAGVDQVLTRAKLIDLVQHGSVRYFLLPGTIPPLLRELTDWITSMCKQVPYSVWSLNKSLPEGTRIAGLRLYEYIGTSQFRPKPHHRHSVHVHQTTYDPPSFYRSLSIE